MNYFRQQIPFVNGIESARTYPLSPNCETILMDSNNPLFYYVQSDASGYKNIQIFKFEKYEEPRMEDKYVTKEELKEMLKELKNEPTKNKQQTKSKSDT